MRTRLITALAALAAVATMPASAGAEEPEHRELGAHVHGHGNLNIAVEARRVTMELDVPAMDIVGFEHDATTDEQKAQVEKAKAQLGKPLEVFRLPAAAGCTVAEAEVELGTEHHEEGEHADHDKKEEHAAGAKGDDGEEEHKTFEVAYEFECTNPASLTSIEFDYFKLFAGAQNLTVNVVTEKAQNTYEVSRDKPALDLAGIM